MKPVIGVAKDVLEVYSADDAAQLFGKGSPLHMAMLPRRPTLKEHLDDYFGAQYAATHSPRVVTSNRTGWRAAVIRFGLWVAVKAGAEVKLP